MLETSHSSILPPPYKIVLLGDSSVGKTSLVHRFTTNRFDTHTPNTIGAAFITKEFSPHENHERKVKLEIWDTAGQERYRSLTPMYYRNARVALVCFDLSKFESTFNTAKYWIQQLELNNSSDSREKIEIRLVGTKRDLVSTIDDATKDQVNKLITEQSNVVKFHETSSKEGTGIESLFEAIVTNIEETFFTQYYEQNRDTSDQIGNMLRTRQTSNSYCC